MQAKQRTKILHAISYDHKHRSALFLGLDVPQQVEIILLLSKRVQLSLLKELSNEHIIELVNHLDPDDATDVIQLLPKKQQEYIIDQLTEHLRKSVAMLLNFDPETAAGLMNLDYILVQATVDIATVADAVREHEKRTGKHPTILVLKDGKLVGQLLGHKLAFAKPNELAGDYVKKVSTIAYNARSKEVIQHFRSHPHSKVVVLGEKDQVLGLIYTDDIIKLLQTNEAVSLYNFAGLSDEESIYDSTSRKVFFRYKWLIVNLGTSFLAAFTVGLFDATISKHVLLAVYMPIVAGMGGNAGTQTLAVMVRGLSQHNIGWLRTLATLKSEILAGLVNGVINGVIVTTVVYLLNRDILIGIVLGLAMVTNLFIAGTFGTLVPVLMKKLGKDPASSATIFITTATDVFGFLAFLGLATLILK